MQRRCRRFQFMIKFLSGFTGHALGIWICGCSLFYRREFWTSKSAGFNSSKSVKICGCKRCCPKDLRVCAPTAPVLTHSLTSAVIFNIHGSSIKLVQCMPGSRQNRITQSSKVGKIGKKTLIISYLIFRL